MNLIPGHSKAHASHTSKFFVFWFVAAHLAVVFGAPLFFTSSSLVLAILLYLIFWFSIEVGAHKYFTHHAFTAPRWLENTLAILYTLSFNRCGTGILDWAAADQAHHKYSDSKDDPYAPKAGARSFYHSYVKQDLLKNSTPTSLDGQNQSFLLFLNRPSNIILLQVIFIAFIFIVGGFYELGAFSLKNALSFVIWGVFVRYLATHLSQTVSHLLGHGWWAFYRMTDVMNTKSLARNLFWHNVHHKFPDAANNGPYWYQVDLCSIVLSTLHKIGLIKCRFFIDEETYESTKQQNLVKNRNGDKVILPDLRCRYISHAGQLTPELFEKIESMAYTHGRSFDSYLTTGKSLEYFFSPDDKGVMGIHFKGHYIHVIGGLLAAEEHKDELLRHFHAFCQANGWTASVFGIQEHDIELFRKHGFEVSKLGEEQRVHMQEKKDWFGSHFYWMRRCASQMERMGVVCKELRRSDFSEYEWSQRIKELIDLENELLTSKAQSKPMTVFQGNLENGDLRRRRLFVAYSTKNGAEQAEAFVICDPRENGASWGTETYRHRVGGAPNAVAYVVYCLINQFRLEGKKDLSITMIPAMNCSTPIPGDSPIVRTFSMIWDRYLNFLVDTVGVYFFASRFRPTPYPIYVCVYPYATLGSSLAFLETWGAIHVKPIGLLRIWFKMIKNSGERKRLRSFKGANV